MSRPKFDKLLPLFDSKEDFSLTESQYERSTGATLPKRIDYLKKESALSKVAKRYGYEIEVKEKTVCLKRKGL